MKVLLIKTSSMGDVIHTLPALSDACTAIPGIEFHWIVEPGFQEIPSWHSAVTKVYPIPLRKWRQNPWKTFRSEEFKNFLIFLKSTSYDMVIDAQGLLKSAWITRLVAAPRHGLNVRSARGKIAALFYNHRHEVSWKLHAVERVRELFSKALGYKKPSTTPHYGITVEKPLPLDSVKSPFLVFLHGTTWATKHWPETFWCELARYAEKEKFSVLLPWGNEIERQRAVKIAESSPESATVLPRFSLSELAALFSKATALVAVDTGLGHLACALHRPTLSIYGPTSAALTGTLGPHQQHISAEFSCAPCFLRTCRFNTTETVMPPCYEGVTPQKVWERLRNMIQRGETQYADDLVE